MDVSDLDEITAAWKRERPDLDMAPLRISLLLRRTMEVAERRRVALLNEYDLSPSGIDLLATLRRSGNPYRRTPSELARASLLTAGGISQRLDRLERAGMVTRTIDVDDRRVIHVQLTAKGLEAIDAVLGPYMAQEREMLDGLTERQQGELEKLLLRFLASNG
jgi:DNA-binding MarR family transcriptional regulator